MGVSRLELSRNKLFARLPADARLHLASRLERVQLAYGEVLYEPAGKIRHVYFPLTCLVSLLTEVGRNQSLEVGLIGSEGMTGSSLALGSDVSDGRALVQGTGEALRMSKAAFRMEFARNLPLQRSVLMFVNTLLSQVSQTAACNRFHLAEARLARWLLMTSDRMQTLEFRLTQDFLADMLGMRRVGIGAAASCLKNDKAIGYSRGMIRILDRKRLEAAACPCYRVIRRQEDNLPRVEAAGLAA